MRIHQTLANCSTLTTMPYEYMLRYLLLLLSLCIDFIVIIKKFQLDNFLGLIPTRSNTVGYQIPFWICNQYTGHIRTRSKKPILVLPIPLMGVARFIKRIQNLVDPCSVATASDSSPGKIPDYHTYIAHTIQYNIIINMIH